MIYFIGNEMWPACKIEEQILQEKFLVPWQAGGSRIFHLIIAHGKTAGELSPDNLRGIFPKPAKRKGVERLNGIFPLIAFEFLVEQALHFPDFSFIFYLNQQRNPAANKGEHIAE